MAAVSVECEETNSGLQKEWQKEKGNMWHTYVDYLDF